MDTFEIPEEAVHAAAEAYNAKLNWIDANAIDPRLEDAIAFRAALEAAVPHLMAGGCVNAKASTFDVPTTFNP
jgi:hypothetical protein